MKLSQSEKSQVLQAVSAHCGVIWTAFKKTYPMLGIMPAVQVSGRLTRTAGRCWQAEQIVEFGTKFLLHSRETQIIMMHQILPHELAHAADWQLYGESELKCGHGKHWREIMINYGAVPLKFHNMTVA